VVDENGKLTPSWNKEKPMITKEQLDRALAGIEPGRKLRLTFNKNVPETRPFLLRTVLALDQADVIQFSFFDSLSLFWAMNGRWEKETYDIAIGPNFASYSRARFELTLLGCLENIEVL